MSPTPSGLSISPLTVLESDSPDLNADFVLFAAWQQRMVRSSLSQSPIQIILNDQETALYDLFGRVQTLVESTGAIGRLIKAGMKEINYLNAIMYNKYSRNGDWKSASHIERTPRKKKYPENPTGGSTPT